MKRRRLGGVPVEPRSSGELGGEAVRDGTEILRRREADEADASAARRHYRSCPMAGLTPNDEITPLLACDERVLSVRTLSAIDRRHAGSADRCGLQGPLYLTSSRLVLLGSTILSFPLEEIEDAIVSGDRLLLALRGGSGVAIMVERPRLLRVEIAAARASARRWRSGSSSRPESA